MRPFEDFITTHDVRKVSIDQNLAKSLIDQSLRRFNYVEKEVITEENRDFVLDNYYEALRTIADAWLAINGYKSYSHEATISFLLNEKDFEQSSIEKFDRLRRLRNGIHYYGKRVALADSRDARELAKMLFVKLKSKINTKINQKVN